MKTLPQGFDATSYATVWRHAALIVDPNDTTKPLKQNGWFAFGSAWTGMAFRLRAAREFARQRTPRAQIKPPSKRATHVERLRFVVPRRKILTPTFAPKFSPHMNWIEAEPMSLRCNQLRAVASRQFAQRLWPDAD